MVDYASIVNSIKDLVTKINEEDKKTADSVDSANTTVTPVPAPADVADVVTPTPVVEDTVDNTVPEPEPVPEPKPVHKPFIISDDKIKELVDSILSDKEAHELSEKIQEMVKRIQEEIIDNLSKIKPDNETVKDLIDPTKRG